MIKFTCDGKEYELGFNRKTAAAAQRNGLDTNELATKPLVQVPLLFFWAFQMKHPNIKGSKTEEIYNRIGDKTGLIRALTVDYISTYKDLFEDTEEEDGGENFIQWSSDN